MEAKKEERRTFRWLATTGLAAIGVGLVAIFGSDYARPLATIGLELGAAAFLLYGLYRVFSGRITDVHD